jgi:16S rRNA (guanine1207-N2)-methyltransferase
MTTIRLYTREGTVVSRIDKDIQGFLRSLDVKAGQIVVDYGCSTNGQIGLSIASRFPSSTVYMVADNIKDAKTIRKSVEENRLSNVSIHIDDSLEFLEQSTVDLIIIKPAGYEGKENLRAKIANSLYHLALGGRLYLMAHMHRGAPSLIKIVDEIFSNHEIIGKGGGIRIVEAIKTTTQAKESRDSSAITSIKAQISDREYTFQTNPALFSKDQIDMGSLLLLDALEVGEGQAILDLGCGYGVLGIVIADQHPDSQVTLVDIDIQAIKATAANMHLNSVQRNTRVLLSDGFEELQGATFDLILSHFPLHIPKVEQERLLSGAKNALNVGGRFYLVVHSAYDLRPMLQYCFNTISIVTDTNKRANPGERYRVLCATK